MNPRVFVSHAHADTGVYGLLVGAIDAAGIDRWDVGEISAGGRLADELQAAIAKCDVCVFIATPRSIESRWCLAELGAFWGAGKRVIIFFAVDGLVESDLPPQFQGNLWATTAEAVIAGIHDAPVESSSRVDPLKILDAVPEAVFVKDEDGRYVYCNHAFRRMFGREDLVGMTDLDAFPRDEQAYHFALTDSKAFGRNDKYRFFETVKDHHDAVDKLYLTVKSTFGSDNGPRYVVGVCSDLRSVNEQLIDAFRDHTSAANSAEYKKAKKKFEAGIDHRESNNEGG